MAAVNVVNDDDHCQDAPEAEVITVTNDNAVPDVTIDTVFLTWKNRKKPTTDASLTSTIK
jgi:hypothetical protein